MHTAQQPAASRTTPVWDPGPVLSLEGIGTRQGGRPILRDVSFDVPQGTLVALLGVPGSGKSALIHLLAGADAPAVGRVMYRGLPLHRTPPHQRGFGVVAQREALFPHLSLAANVAYPLRLRGTPRLSRAKLVREGLESVLLDQAWRLPRDAGPAACQRAAIARATVFGPDVLLLDEPLGDQPAESRADMVAALRRLHLLLGCTTLLATRVAADAMALADLVVVLHAGGVEQVAPPLEVYDMPASALAAAACGDVNLLPGTVSAIDEDGVASVVLACGPTVEGAAGPGLRAGGQCLFCLRPERIAVAPVRAAEMGEAALDATLLDVLHLGDQARLRLLLGSGAEVVVKRALAPGLRHGQSLAIAWQEGHAAVFPV